MNDKPDWKDAPDWAEYLAQHYCGSWMWFDAKPRASGFAWCGTDRFEPAGRGDKNPDSWLDTLEQRPTFQHYPADVPHLSADEALASTYAQIRRTTDHIQELELERFRLIDALKPLAELADHFEERDYGRVMLGVREKDSKPIWTTDDAFRARDLLRSLGEWQEPGEAKTADLPPIGKCHYCTREIQYGEMYGISGDDGPFHMHKKDCQGNDNFVVSIFDQIPGYREAQDARNREISETLGRSIPKVISDAMNMLSFVDQIPKDQTTQDALERAMKKVAADLNIDIALDTAIHDSLAGFGHAGVRMSADGSATPFNDTDIFIMEETPPCMGNAPPVDGAVRNVSDVEPLPFGRGFMFTYQRRINGEWVDCDQVAKTRDGAEHVRAAIIGRQPAIAAFPGGIGID